MRRILAIAFLTLRAAFRYRVVLVMALLLRAVFSGEQAITARRWVLGGGVVLPVSVLTLLLLWAYFQFMPFTMLFFLCP